MCDQYHLESDLIHDDTPLKVKATPLQIDTPFELENQTVFHG